MQNPDGSLPAWLTPERQRQYREEHWDLDVHGACMFYAASTAGATPARRQRR